MPDLNEVSPLKPCEQLFFEDGSIVLATDKHLYCVHKSVLSRNSSVFEDMMGLPNSFSEEMAESESMETMTGERKSWGGKPLVRMAGDSDENVYHFLMALYNHTYFRANKPTTLAIISSLLIMSNKYNVAFIQNEVIDHLEISFPTKLEKLDNFNIKKLFLGSNWELQSVEDGDYNSGELTFYLLSISLQINATTVLPMLYYECAVQTLGEILRLSRKFMLKPEDADKIVVGHEALLNWSSLFYKQAIFHEWRCGVISCTGSKFKLISALLSFDGSDSSKFPRSIISDGLGIASIGTDKLRRDMCFGCMDKAKASIAKSAQKFWDELPKIFGLGEWANLKRE